MNKRIISLLAAGVMTVSALGIPAFSGVSRQDAITASADTSSDRLYPYSYSWRWESFTKNKIEKTIDLYYLENGISALGYSVPSSLPTEYVIPEWNDYKWSTNDIAFYVDRTVFESGTITISESEKRSVTKGFRKSDYYVTDNVYGLSNDGNSMIHYIVRFHNYANKLREDKAREWVNDNITDDMTTLEKVEAVVRKTTYGAYDGGVDVVLGTSSGDCIDYSMDALYFFDALGIPARVRFAGNDYEFESNHYNNWVMIDNELYIVDCTPWGNKTTEGYLKSLTSNFDKITGNETWIMTDNKYAYRLLDDGTLELFDIIGLGYDLPEVWTVPESTVINGKEYRISKLGTINYLTFSDLNFDSVKEVIVPPSVEPDSSYDGVFSSYYFPNLEKMTLNETIHDFDWIRSFSTGSKDDYPVAVDASMTSIDTVNGNSGRYYLLPFINAVTVYTKVTDTLQKAYDSDNEHNSTYRWNLVDVSAPNTHTITIIVPENDNRSLRMKPDKMHVPLAPLNKIGNVYEFPYMPDGEYAVTYTLDDGETYSETVTLAGKDITVRVGQKAQLGDLNSDGDVNMLDLALMQQSLAGWEINISDAAADVDGSGAFDMLDLALMQQKLSGCNVSFGKQS